MIHELKMLLIKGLNGDRIIDAISSGVEDGYRESEGIAYQVVTLAEGYEGLSMINEADPLDISVPVKTYDEAVAIFSSLLPQDAVVKQEGKTYTWAMTDSLGNDQGEIVLTEGSTPDSIAVMRRGKGKKIDPAPARMPAASDKMRMIYCYCFKPNGDKIKFW